MWVFPLAAAIVAAAFAGALLRQYRVRRRSYQVLWAVALSMYAVASFMVFLGVLGGWSAAEFRWYWALGAVLNVPFLAQGELDLLTQRPWIRWSLYVLLAFVTAYTIAVVRTAEVSAEALQQELPSGKEVFGDGSPAHRLPQLIAIPAYLVLVGGALWSAWRMRGIPELRGRFWGVLLIAAGATVIAGFASAFAALGHLAPFALALLVGVTVMFWGFLLASRDAGARSGSPSEIA
jgi:hypothetical protein